MAKEAGLANLLFIAGYDLSGDVGSIGTIASHSTPLDVTAINASAMERILSHHDGEISFNHYFNDAASQEHAALAAAGAGLDRVVCWYHGSGIGEAAAGLVSKQINYDLNRGADGSLGGTTQCLANAAGLEYGEQLTAGKRTDTSATNGTSLNNGAATALGLSAYLQVFSVAGTSVTVAVQQSSDDGGGDAYAAILTFTTVSAGSLGHERKVTATLTTAVEQYLRVATTGTFSSAIFAVCASRTPYAL